jgi:hypothetical protein
MDGRPGMALPLSINSTDAVFVDESSTLSEQSAYHTSKSFDQAFSTLDERGESLSLAGEGASDWADESPSLDGELGDSLSELHERIFAGQ